jgi:hypothetical protein
MTSYSDAIRAGDVIDFCELISQECGRLRCSRTGAGRQSPSLASRLGPDGRPSPIAKEENLMGMYALIEDARGKELADAIAAANEWQKAGRPIILAALKVLRADDDLSGLYADRPRDYHEAHDVVVRASDSLFEMLEGIRDDFLCDQRKSWSRELSEEEGEYVDVFNDELEDAVMSIRDFEKLVEREDYEAFIRGEQ